MVSGRHDAEPDPGSPEQPDHLGPAVPYEGGHRQSDDDRVHGVQARHRRVLVRDRGDEPTGVVDPGLRERVVEALEREHAQAHLVAARAALSRLDELATEAWVPQDALTYLRSHYEKKLRTLTEAIDGAGNERFDGHAPAHQRLQQEVLTAERAAVIGLRDQGRIDDETLRLVERELDLEEQRWQG